MPSADLVLEGGGVKGSGLVGAVTALQGGDDPYEFQRYAGTSAGAIVASLLAAGYSGPELKRVMEELDFLKFQDLPRMFRAFPGAKRFGAVLGLVFRRGMYRTGFMHDWIEEKLSAKGVRTWADLRQPHPESALPVERRYRLVVVVSDVTSGRMLRMPWDARERLGLDPDAQPVADAVTSSASIPFFFRPFRLGESMIVDGGLLSNYPIAIFDRGDGDAARWPTIGIKLSARDIANADLHNETKSIFQFAVSVLRTLLGAHDRVYVSDPSYASRTVFVDTTGYSATQFDLTPADKQKLFDSGEAAGQAFLRCWDWEKWKAGDFAPIIAGVPRS
jgi:NTE family protein